MVIRTKKRNVVRRGSKFDLRSAQDVRLLRELREVKKRLGKLEKIDSRVVSEEKKIEFKEDVLVMKQKKLEQAMFQLGKFTFRRKHMLEVIRGVAGSFLGVGLGRQLLNMETLASSLAWWNIFGILIFVLAISALLLYKNEKDFIARDGLGVVWRKLAFLYVMALAMEVLALFLFGGLPGSGVLLFKVVVIGSYSAMAGAVSFSLI